MATTGDPYYSKVVLLLLGQGANNSQAITDSSSVPKTITVLGDTKISTAQGRDYPTSLCFDGSGDFLTLQTALADLAFGAGDFCIDAFVYPTSNSGTRVLLAGQGDLATVAGSSFVLYTQGGTSDLYMNSSVYSAASPAPPLNTWSYIAYSKFGTSWSTYLNTSRVGYNSSIPSGWAVNAGATLHKPSIGAFDTGANAFAGYMYLRITMGESRHSGATCVIPDNFYDFVNATFHINCTITESLAATSFIARAYEFDSGALVGSLQVTDTSQGFLLPVSSARPCFVTITADYKVWGPSTVYALDDKVYPTNPVAKPYCYKRIAAGTSSASTEPMWPTAEGGRCNDGAVSNAWELFEGLSQPITQGPLIPA